MFIGDVTPTNIRDYVRQCHITDERTGAWGRGQLMNIWGPGAAQGSRVALICIGKPTNLTYIFVH
jgi:hypothetical protein